MKKSMFWLTAALCILPILVQAVAPSAAPPPFSPAQIHQVIAATLRYTQLPVEAGDAVPQTFCQTLVDAEPLARIESLMAGAEDSGEGQVSKCPFGYALLTLTMADGSSVTLDIAADSCTMYMAGGRSYYYMPVEFRGKDEHPDNRILLDLFHEIPMTEWLRP